MLISLFPLCFRMEEMKLKETKLFDLKAAVVNNGLEVVKQLYMPAFMEMC